MRTMFIGYYAEEKIRERNISYSDIPDLNKLSLGIHKVSKKVGDRELIAFYKISKDAIVLMTAYWRTK